MTQVFLELFLFFSFGRAIPHGLRLGLKYFDDLNPISFSLLFDLTHWASSLNKSLYISDEYRIASQWGNFGFKATRVKSFPIPNRIR
jgi:hypothetical protein